ncbi:MAG: acetolactate decarboxylase [Thermodesulfobacteriota bacterium]
MNKTARILCCALAIAFFSTACASRHTPAPAPTLTLVSTISGLLAGDYDGTVSIGELLAFGNTGTGTLHALDGELIVLDGRAYQVTSEGKVKSVSPDALTPFAAVAPFTPDRTAEIAKPVDFEGLAEKTLGLCANPDVFCVLKVHGHFPKMKTRSPAVQEKPYPPLVEATRYQAEFSRSDVTGTIVGFYSPAYASGVSIPGFHLHFLSDDHKSGGHVLSFSMDKGELSVMPVYRVTLLLPDKPFSVGAPPRDAAKELKEAEGERK